MIFREGRKEGGEEGGGFHIILYIDIPL